MTKTLTENKWFYTENGIKDASWNIVFKSEVLAPVPSYEEYNELLRHSKLSRNLVYEVLVNQKEYNELLDKAKEYKRLQEQKQKVIALIKDGRFVEALQELEK